jgi:hypothetical protein
MGLAKQVVFHTKAHPTFVSDATTRDCQETLRYLSERSEGAVSELAQRMIEMVDQGQLVFEEDLYWCQPSPFWTQPDHVQEKLSNACMVFVKGDANYRRLLGERQWPLNTPARDVLSYWKVPVCALRTFKAEIGCGVSVENEQRARAKDPCWMVSGQWGVIQLGGPVKSDE